MTPWEWFAFLVLVIMICVESWYIRSLAKDSKAAEANIRRSLSHLVQAEKQIKHISHQRDQLIRLLITKLGPAFEEEIMRQRLNGTPPENEKVTAVGRASVGKHRDPDQPPLGVYTRTVD